MNPWEKYAPPASTADAAPWEKYGAAGAAPAAKGGAVPALDRLPPDSSPAQLKPEHADSIANKLLGLGEAGLSVATSIPASVAGQAYGIGKTLTGGKYGTQEGARQGEQA